MHFKTFVLRTPSVPPLMMSLALCLGGREVVKGCEDTSMCMSVCAGSFCAGCCRHLVARGAGAAGQEGRGVDYIQQEVCW